jgi:hypothetical protein
MRLSNGGSISTEFQAVSERIVDLSYSHERLFQRYHRQGIPQRAKLAAGVTFDRPLALPVINIARRNRWRSRQRLVYQRGHAAQPLAQCPVDEIRR